MTGTVAVVGGGTAGGAAAIALARHGARAVVLDAGPSEKVGECLPPLANPLLNLLGLADRMEADGHRRSYGVRAAWGSAGATERDFLFGRSGPGWHLDRPAFESRLAATAREVGVEWRSGIRVAGVRKDGCRWVVSGETAGSGFRVEADFLVDATGRGAFVARRLGVGRAYLDRLVGVTGVFRQVGLAPTGDFSQVEAVREGWWYSAPLPGERLSVIYLTDADLPGSAAARTVGGWLALLRDAVHTSRRASTAYSGPERLKVVTAATSRLVRFTGDGWAAVGDAAATFDPLSSHGIYSALAGGYQAGRAIARGLAGYADELRLYEVTMCEAFRDYLLLRTSHYEVERRWSEEPFWRRRHETVS